MLLPLNAIGNSVLSLFGASCMTVYADIAGVSAAGVDCGVPTVHVGIGHMSRLWSGMGSLNVLAPESEHDFID